MSEVHIMRKMIGLTTFGLLTTFGGAQAASVQHRGPIQVAQASGNNTNAGAGSSAAQPESMRIQEQTTRQYYNGPASGSTGTNGTTSGPTTESPLNGSSSSVERNRIDTGGPPRQRLQVDDGVAGAVRGTGTNNAASPNNTIVRGAPSTSGTATGTSTTAASPTTSSPGAVSSPGTAGSSAGGTAGSSSTGASSGASGSSGGGGGGSSSGGGGH